MPHISRGRGSRQTGTSAPVARGSLVKARIAGRQIIGLRQEPQRRGGVGRAAAEPGGDRELLVELERAHHEAGAARRESARGFEHEIVGIGAGLRCPRPADG